MQARITKKFIQKSFLLSIIFHLLLLLFLLTLSTIITFNPVEKTNKPPELYIPSYVYKGAITPRVHTTPTENASTSQPAATTEPPKPMIQKTQTEPSPLFSQPKQISSARKNNFSSQSSILAMSRNMIRQNQIDTAVNNLNDSEPPILLVGDKHAAVDPLVKLVGRSLSAHFHYPKIEGIFGARGRVYIELVLHPEGYFSDVQIVQGSDIQDFNAAALYAVNTAPTVVGVDKFLPRPKRFIVGFIFE